ncbi:Putative MCE family protein [Mycobacteroides abscessus]|nr:Putative MCE family protein [Mycobacteroides abscessus]
MTTILGSRYLDLQPEGPGSLPNKTIDLAHTEVPYDLQATLRDATNTFDQVDFDKVAQSLSILGKQLDGLPEVVPQAMQNIQTLSQIIAERRDQLGTLLKSSEKVTNTLRHQQQGIGTLINQGQNLIGEFVVRRGTFHAMMQSLTNLVQQLSKITIKDRPQLDEMLKTLHQLTDMLGQHDDLLRNILQITPVTLRGVANATGTGNAIEFNAPNGLAVDSWMCAISGRAKQFGMIQYFKDCK